MQYTHILHDVAGLYNYTLCLSIHAADLDGSQQRYRSERERERERERDVYVCVCVCVCVCVRIMLIIYAVYPHTA